MHALKPWLRKAAPPPPPEPEALDPLTQARKELLQELVQSLIPPHLQTVISPMLSQAFQQLDAPRGQAVVDLIYEVAGRFRMQDEQYPELVTRR